ncbi:hypothetical protein PV379_05140 [Streptomyces caniscabiei]|uniref:hypothetical protein n=1 Tax=Streptomyces caniscabiei TaxID=2746961 RepID=UPI0029B970CA|nr:hypothetical protein [Streptomyces caniscabiei]MDX2599685.1 hypothetical protein [Streptomyces caniscabiei]MDX2735020.1 hypothetical protein [Streptomyces caniscabiei]MDX2776716.1 hypothetical protein [Streptomyces caniscabiei]
MSTLQSRGRRAVVVAAVAATLASTIAAAPADRPVNEAGVSLAGPAAKPFRLTGQRHLSGGTYETTWTDGRTTVEAATGARAKVRLTQESGRLRVDVTPQAEQEQASALAADLEPGDRIGEPVCAEVSAEDGHVHSRGCVQRKFDADTPTGRYVVDETQQSSSAEQATYFAYNLRSTETLLSYGDGAVIHQWVPGKTESIGDCMTITMGFEGNSGFNFSWSKEICGEKFGPIPGSPDEHSFGYHWEGYSDSGQTVEVVGATHVYVPTRTAPSRTLTLNLEWDWAWCPGFGCDW